MSLNQSTAPTGRTQIDDAIATEFLWDRMQLLNLDPKVGLMIAGQIQLTPEESNSLTFQVVVPNEFGGFAAVADNDAAPEEALETTNVQITGAQYGLRAFTLWLAMRLGIGRPLGKVQDGLLHAAMDYWHQQILGLFTSLSASTGTNATLLTLANWDTITGLHRTQNHDNLPLWACFGGAAVRQLRNDLRSSASALYGSAFGDATARALLNTKPGMGVNFDGYTLHESDDVPAGDTTGITGALGCGGPESEENATFARVLWVPAEFYAQNDASRFGTWTVIGNAAGVGVMKDGNGRAFITSAA